jgi:hypothetical protein
MVRKDVIYTDGAVTHGENPFHFEPGPSGLQVKVCGVRLYAQCASEGEIDYVTATLHEWIDKLTVRMKRALPVSAAIVNKR